MTDATTIELVSGGRTHVLRRASVVAGRGDDCDLHVVQPLVSREHCRIEARAEGVFVFDLGSHNGTWVNGERIDAVRRVRSGDRIRLGAEGVEFVLARALVDGRDVADLPSDTNANTADIGDARAAGQPARISVRPANDPPRDLAKPASAEPASAEIVAPLPPDPAPAQPHDARRASPPPPHRPPRGTPPVALPPSLPSPPSPQPPPPHIQTDCRGALGGPQPEPPVSPHPPAHLPPTPPRIGILRRAALFLAGLATGVALVAALAVFTDFPERLARVLPLLGIADPAHEGR